MEKIKLLYLYIEGKTNSGFSRTITKRTVYVIH